MTSLMSCSGMERWKFVGLATRSINEQGMNSKNAKDYLPLVQALAEGRTIQIQSAREGWLCVDGEIGFELPSYLYRIKPEPREPRRWWILFSMDRALVYTDEESARRYAPITPNSIIEVVEVMK